MNVDDAFLQGASILARALAKEAGVVGPIREADWGQQDGLVVTDFAGQKWHIRPVAVLHAEINQPPGYRESNV